MHIFMLVYHWVVIVVMISLVWGKIVIRDMAILVLSVVSVSLLLILVVFWDTRWVVSGLMDRFLMMDRLLVSDREVCSDRL